ncbi:MAG: GDSL-type esterase/lipase family protein, partial [Bacteroidota bacterium]
LIRFRQDVVNLKPKAVFILAGINDIAGNTGPSDLAMIFNNIQSMAEIGMANNIKVIICSVLPAAEFPWRPEIDPTDKVVALNKMLKEYATKKGIMYLDYFASMANEENGMKKQFTYDEVHCTDEGYAAMEKVIHPILEKLK